MAIQYGKAMGLKVLAVDGGSINSTSQYESKESMCLQLGADVYMDFTKESDVVSAVKQITDGGSHIVMVLVPNQKVYEYVTTI